MDVMILYFSLGDPEWIKRAACRAAEDDVFYFPEPESEGKPTGEELGKIRSESSRRELVAKTKYCSACPSRGRCAVEGWKEEFGIWGGWTPAERRQIDRGDYAPSRIRGQASTRRDEAVRLVRQGLSIEDVAIKMNIGIYAVGEHLRANWAVVTQSDNR
jgi:hypothetical protein